MGANRGSVRLQADASRPYHEIRRVKWLAFLRLTGALVALVVVRVAGEHCVGPDARRSTSRIELRLHLRAARMAKLRAHLKSRRVRRMMHSENQRLARCAFSAPRGFDRRQRCLQPREL